MYNKISQNNMVFQDEINQRRSLKEASKHRLQHTCIFIWAKHEWIPFQEKQLPFRYNQLFKGKNLLL